MTKKALKQLKVGDKISLMNNKTQFLNCGEITEIQEDYFTVKTNGIRKRIGIKEVKTFKIKTE